MPTIILSYRREDTEWIAGRVHDRLKDHFGEDNVFMDIRLDYAPCLRSRRFRDDIQDLRTIASRHSIVAIVAAPTAMSAAAVYEYAASARD